MCFLPSPCSEKGLIPRKPLRAAGACMEFFMIFVPGGQNFSSAEKHPRQRIFRCLGCCFWPRLSRGPETVYNEKKCLIKELFLSWDGGVRSTDGGVSAVSCKAVFINASNGTLPRIFAEILQDGDMWTDQTGYWGGIGFSIHYINKHCHGGKMASIYGACRDVSP